MTNKKFENLTKPEQRVAILKDAIKQIHAKRIVPERRVYLEKVNEFESHLPEAPCRACGIGALFVSQYKLSGSSGSVNDCFNDGVCLKHDLMVCLSGTQL